MRNTQPKLRRIRKLWGKGLRSLPAIDGKRYRAAEELATIPTGLNTEFDVTDDDVNEIAKTLGDDNLAKRIRKMQREKYTNATVLELVLVDFLDREGEKYVYQAMLYGGNRPGGVIPDFLLVDSGTAVLANGQFWHNRPEVRASDETDKLKIKGSYFEGTLIRKVIEVWENQVMQPNPQRENALQGMLAGIEYGQ